MDTKNVADTLISFMKNSPAPKKTRKAKEKEDTNLADVLMKKPKPDKKNTTMPHFTTNLPKDERHQADTLYLPNDKWLYCTPIDRTRGIVVASSLA